MKRDRYVVGPASQQEIAAGCRKWRVKRNGHVLSYCDAQYEGIDLVVTLARSRLNELGQTAELHIKGRNGRIRDSRTYGNDPKSIKG